MDRHQLCRSDWISRFERQRHLAVKVAEKRVKVDKRLCLSNLIDVCRIKENFCFFFVFLLKWKPCGWMWASAPTSQQRRICLEEAIWLPNGWHLVSKQVHHCANRRWICIMKLKVSYLYVIRSWWAADEWILTVYSQEIKRVVSVR